MTRDEAVRKVMSVEKLHMINLVKFRDITNEIYDDFESRTCENCKHVYEITHIGTDKIFGLDCSNYESDMYGNEVYNSTVCNKWESK